MELVHKPFSSYFSFYLTWSSEESLLLLFFCRKGGGGVGEVSELGLLHILI